MLRFAEEISLLLLDDDGRESMRLPMWSMRTLFAAAVLMDLALENRIDTDLDRLFLVDARPLGDDLLDGALARIAEAPVRDTAYWLDDLAEREAGLHDRALGRLADRGILRQKAARAPWHFRPRRHPLASTAAQQGIRRRVLRVLSDPGIPTPRDIALICLVDACGLVERLFPDDVRQRVAARLEQVRKMDLIGRSLSRAIWDIRSTLLSGEAERPLIGLALGAGAAHGWAHIGAIRCLAEAGIAPDVVCGTSAGALVGGLYAAGKLDVLEDWARGFGLARLADYMTLAPGRSLFGSKRFFRELAGHCRGTDLGELETPFAAVTMELATGREIWLRKGPLLRAVSASIAYPGLFPPVKVDNRWMVDGTLVNPVPVSACRALGAQLVIAVSLGREPGGRQAVARPPQLQPAAPKAGAPTLLSMFTSLLRHGRKPNRADLWIKPRPAGFGLPGLGQAHAAIDEGRRAAREALRAMTHTYSALA